MLENTRNDEKSEYQLQVGIELSNQSKQSKLMPRLLQSTHHYFLYFMWDPSIKSSRQKIMIKAAMAK